MFKLAGKILDQNDDVENIYNFQVDEIPSEIITEENIKEATELEPSEYALVLLDNGKTYKKFPTDTPIDTFISAWYFSKTASELPKDVAIKVASYIVKRYMEQEIPITSSVEPTFLLAEENFDESKPVKIALSTIDNPTIKEEKYEKLAEISTSIKQAAKLTPEERESLPDSAFGLVKIVNGQKIRKYPMHDENHVRAAIVFFSKNHQNMSPEDREKVAKKIKEKAREYGIEITEDSPVSKYASSNELMQELQVVYKYASETIGNGIYFHLRQRIKLASPSAKAKYAEFYDGITQMPDLPPLEVAKILDEIDQEAGLKGKVTDAYEAVYDIIKPENTKIAEEIKKNLVESIVPEAKYLPEAEQKKLEEFIGLSEKDILDLLDD